MRIEIPRRRQRARRILSAKFEQIRRGRLEHPVRREPVRTHQPVVAAAQNEPHLGEFLGEFSENSRAECRAHALGGARVPVTAELVAHGNRRRRVGASRGGASERQVGPKVT